MKSNTTNSELEPIMTTYLLTKEELEELLRKQRGICAENADTYIYPYLDACSECGHTATYVNRGTIINAPSPPLPVNKESVIDWERIEEEAKKKFYWNYNSEWINWLKTNLPKYINHK